MRDGGTLRITGTNLRLDSAFCAGKDLIAGEHVRLSIADNGSGMRPEILEHAFETFFTTKPGSQPYQWCSPRGIPETFSAITPK